MRVRTPVVAGQFYPGSPEQCRVEVESYLSASPPIKLDVQPPIDRVMGGIAPHAGWVCSGAVAAQVIDVLSADADIETYVVFGAMHRLAGANALLYAAGSWQLPSGEIDIDEPLASALVGASPLLAEDLSAHSVEHSIEVQVPFIQKLNPKAKLLPIIVPPTASAPDVGKLVAEQVEALGRRVVYLGSTDLTHYGPRYQFTPQGAGEEAIKWAKEVNDKRMIDLMLALRDDGIVEEARMHHNACGAGAVAATIAACRTAGASHAHLLQHTTSAEVLHERLGRMSDAVGYAGVIFYKTANS